MTEDRPTTDGQTGSLPIRQKKCLKTYNAVVGNIKLSMTLHTDVAKRKHCIKIKSYRAIDLRKGLKGG